MRDLEFIRRSPAVSGDRPGIRGSPAKWSQEPLVGGPLPTRHGQDDGSLTNSLKQEISTDEYRVLAIPNGHTLSLKMNGADER